MRDITPPAASAEDWADALVGSIHTRTGAVQSWLSRSERQCKRTFGLSTRLVRKNIRNRFYLIKPCGQINNPLAICCYCNFPENILSVRYYPGR